MPLILPGIVASATAGGYEVANSCRFNDGDSPYMYKMKAENDEVNTVTFSVWVKRSTISAVQRIISHMISGFGDYFYFRFNSADTLEFAFAGSASQNVIWTTNRLFRDVGAWYHIVVRINTTDGTAGDRVRIYVNGVQETSFSASLNPDQNSTLSIGRTGDPIVMGALYGEGYGISSGSTTEHFDGYMAEICVCEGQSLAPTSFGEFDEDSPTIWKPKDVSGLTFGTNGFYLDFEASDNLGNDKNGGTDLTEANLAATDQTTDTPTNNFATANPLNVNAGGVATFAEGNTEVTSPTATGVQFMSSSTLGMTAGKWYCEVKIITVDSLLVGVSATSAEDARDDLGPGMQGGAQSVSILCNDGNRYIDDSAATHGAATSADGIMMIALDLDNNNVYFGTGGNWFDGSGNADESSPNSAIAVTAVGSTIDGAYFFSCVDGGGSATAKVQWNFGNPPYANSSSVSDANGYGAFEYTVPSGYLALCTKNLGSTGG